MTNNTAEMSALLENFLVPLDFALTVWNEEFQRLSELETICVRTKFTVALIGRNLSVFEIYQHACVHHGR